MITLEQSIELEPKLIEVQKWVVDNIINYSEESHDDWMRFYSGYKKRLGVLVGWFREAKDSHTKNPELMNSEIWDIWINWFFEVTGY